MSIDKNAGAAEGTIVKRLQEIQETHEPRSAHARGSAAAHLFDIQPDRQPFLGRSVQVKFRKPLRVLLPAGCLPARAQPHQSFDMQSPDIVQTDRAPPDTFQAAPQVGEAVHNFVIRQPVLWEPAGNS